MRDAAHSSVAISHQLVGEAKSAAAASGRRVLDVLEEKAGLAPELFVESLARAFHHPVATMDDLNGMTADFGVLPFGEAARRECVAVRERSGRLVIVFADPFRPDLQDWIEARVSDPFSWRIAHAADIAAFLLRHEETMRAMDGVLAETPHAAGIASEPDNLSIQSINEDASQVVRLVHSTLYDAYKANASDIHLESDATGLSIRYRVDGVLSPVGRIAGVAQAEQVLSRIKVMSELDIAERRVPQDGRFKVVIRGREVDFRVSVMPSMFGEDAVLRILDRRAPAEQQAMRLDHLGFDGATISNIRRLAAEPYGMLLVTGPTGSGKTTTLYAVISEINRGQDKIVTIEDPIEYHLPGVLQIPVNEKKGLTFSRGLRSILRHDPDKIMVGEIRDVETAQIAVQSALTGHLVLTTVHANNVFDVIGRFVHMDVDSYSFVSALNGVLAQRLLRMVCPQCAETCVPGADALREAGIDPDSAAQYRFVQGRGCGHCRGTGYKGRRAIAETLILNDEIRELIIARDPIRLVKEAARRNGTRYLREAALDLLKTGETSLQEVNRVTFVA